MSVPGDTFEFEALAAANNYRRAILSEFSPYLKGDVLEVGAGVGHATEELSRQPAVRRITAIEPMPAFCDALRKRVPAAEVILGTSTDLGPRREFDAVLSVNVLEHIADDAAELRRYYSVLRARQGHLCLFIPAGPELFAPLDRQFGHYRRYRLSGLRGALERAGFATVRMRNFNFPGYFLWWLEFRVLRQKAFNPRKVALFDRLIFPWIHRAETRVLAPPLGQSILAVARAI